MDSRIKSREYFKQILTFIVSGAVGGLIGGIFSFGKFSNAGLFADIIIGFIFGAIIGVSFAIVNSLMQNKGQIIRIIIRTVIRGLSCVIISLSIFGISYMLEDIFGASGLFSFIVFIGFVTLICTHILVAIILGISMGLEITYTMSSILQCIGGFLGGILLIPIADYIFSYTYYKAPFQTYVLGSLVGFSIAIGLVLSKRKRI